MRGPSNAPSNAEPPFSRTELLSSSRSYRFISEAQGAFASAVVTRMAVLGLARMSRRETPLKSMGI